MHRFLVPAHAVLVLTTFTFAGCASTSAPSVTPPAATITTTAPGASTARPLPRGAEPVDLDPARFTTEITNPYFPMSPGTRWTYRETDGAGGESQVVVVVTGETKKIANGITARVVRDTVTRSGQVVEDTIDWYAQDNDANIWYLGENTAEFEDGKVAGTGGSFEAGVNGALPGILIPGDPQPGQQYRQEYYQGQAEDNGEVLSIREQVQVPHGLFKDALLTKDTIAIEPDVQQYKLYAKGVGPVLALDVSGSSGREELLTVDKAPPSAGTGPLGKPNP